MIRFENKKSGDFLTHKTHNANSWKIPNIHFLEKISILGIIMEFRSAKI